MTSINTTEQADIREMLVVHRVFRREFAVLPDYVRGVPEGDHERRKIVADHARLVLDGLHFHHEGEDAELWPLLATRVESSAELTKRMEAQHSELATLVAEAERLLPTWDTSTAEELAQVLDAINAAVLTHLAEEEAEILPLVAEHITPAEWARLGEHARRAMRPNQLPLMFGAVLEDCDADERTLMLAGLPLPLRLLVKPVIEPRYRRYISKVRAR
ncbi:hemerythrin domain-containing protein [Kribbella jiaozuonensis]|uniref:Hemerythrin domain-containing protein n=1 Tax=Kribbella jiaozuonensis TaxID=2575441 RepID=A0A4U3LQ04_9ACTN|nr:hemerythrin domain-containing protein [Kribbella jiaozuonensis]TKK77770.1 hemerythrin domain-containing protein [Kribbella jiaozuonensis]